MPRMSANGSTLALSFLGDDEPKRGTFLVNLDKWEIKFQATISQYKKPREPLLLTSEAIFLNEDGTRFYLLPREENPTKNGFLYNRTDLNLEIINWPESYPLCEQIGGQDLNHIASPNLNFLARQVGQIHPFYKIEDHWGIIIHTSEGTFVISSPQYDANTHPWRIENDGTLYTSSTLIYSRESGLLADIFKFENHTYTLVKTLRKEPFALKVTKIS